MATKQATAKAKQEAAAKGSKGKEVLKPQSTSLATTDKSAALALPAEIDLLADAGLGTEGIGAKDLAIPRLSVLQSLSPACTKGSEGYVKGAEAGDFWDNVQQKVFAKGDEGFLFIPVSYRRAHLQWKLRKNGGGFVADHGASDAILAKTTKDEDGRQMIDKESEIVPTGEFYILVLDLNGKLVGQAVISFAKTQLKKATRLNSAIKMLNITVGNRAINPAMFYSVFKATTVPESNDKGSWMGWSITRYGNTLDLPDGSDLYNAGKAFHNAVAQGAVKVASPEDDSPNSDAPQSDEDKL